MRAAIIGAGSLGTIIGALMAKAGRPVDLIDTNREHVAALNRDGARIIGEMDLTVPVQALTPEDMTGQYDLVFLLSKQTANQAVLTHLLPFLHAESTVCTLQNGIPRALGRGGDRTGADHRRGGRFRGDLDRAGRLAPDHDRRGHAQIRL